MKKNYYATVVASLFVICPILSFSQTTPTQLNEARPEPITTFSIDGGNAHVQPIEGSNSAALQALQGNWKIAKVLRKYVEEDRNADNYWLLESYKNGTAVTFNNTEFVYAHSNDKLTCRVTATDKEISFHFATAIHPDRVSSTTYQYRLDGALLLMSHKDETLSETYTLSK